MSIGEEPEHDDDIDNDEKVIVESSKRMSQRSEQRVSSRASQHAGAARAENLDLEEGQRNGSSWRRRSQLSRRRESAAMPLGEEIELGDNMGNEEKFTAERSGRLSQGSHQRPSLGSS